MTLFSGSGSGHSPGMRGMAGLEDSATLLDPPWPFDSVPPVAAECWALSPGISPQIKQCRHPNQGMIRVESSNDSTRIKQ
jgi:hypothetical protein